MAEPIEVYDGSYSYNDDLQRYRREQRAKMLRLRRRLNEEPRRYTPDDERFAKRLQAGFRMVNQ